VNENKNTQKTQERSPDTSDEKPSRFGESAARPTAENTNKKTHREKRGELDTVLKKIVEREARQQRIRDGTATETDAHAEGQAIEADAAARSGRVRAGSQNEQI
jgi:hypothetical protein